MDSGGHDDLLHLPLPEQFIQHYGRRHNLNILYPKYKFCIYANKRCDGEYRPSSYRPLRLIKYKTNSLQNKAMRFQNHKIKLKLTFDRCLELLPEQCRDRISKPIYHSEYHFRRRRIKSDLIE